MPLWGRFDDDCDWVANGLALIGMSFQSSVAMYDSHKLCNLSTLLENKTKTKYLQSVFYWAKMHTCRLCKVATGSGKTLFHGYQNVQHNNRQMCFG